MHTFEYRSARFTVDLPVQFVHQHRTVPGRLKEISTDGMKVHLPESLPVGSFGRVLLEYRGNIVEVNVKIAHVQPTSCGLVIIYESPAEKNAVEDLVASLSRNK